MTQATQTSNVIVPLQSLLIAMSDGVLITDEIGRRTYANPALSDLVGMDPCVPANDAGPPAWIELAQHDRYLSYLAQAQGGELDQEILSLEWNLVSATGRRIVYTGIAIDWIEGGRVVEGWHQADELGLLKQLGVTLGQ